MLFIIVVSKFLCAIYMVTLLSGAGTGSTIESTLEPVTGIRNLTLESKTRYNDFLKVYEGFVEDGTTKASVIIDIPEEVETNTDTRIQNINGINDAYRLFEMIDNLKLSISDRDNSFKELYASKDVKREITYNPNNLREKSNLSIEQIYNLLERSKLQVLASSYYEMENKHNVNAIFLMALNIEESGHGTSDLAVLNNNIGGVKSASGGWETFDDWNHSLEYIASLIDEMYLSEDGAYYNGSSIYDVNIRYCEGNQWAFNLNTIAMELLERANSIKDNYIQKL